MNRLFCFAIAVFVVGLSSITLGNQEVVRPSIQPVLYQSETSTLHDQVLDILFPRDVLEEGNIEYVFVLRFLPSFAPESQTIIIERTSGIEVVQYASLSGNLFRRIGEMLEQTGRHDAREIANQLKVEKRLIKLSPIQVKQWRRGFYRSLLEWARIEKKDLPSNEGATFVLLDGTTYNLWYRSGTGTVFYDLAGPEVGKSVRHKNSPLTQWMNEVRLRVIGKQ